MSLDKHRRYTNLTTHVISQDNLSSVQVGNCIIFFSSFIKDDVFLFHWYLLLNHGAYQAFFDIRCGNFEIEFTKGGRRSDGVAVKLTQWWESFGNKKYKHFSLRWTRGLQQTRPRWRSRSGWDPASRAPRSTWRGLSGMRLMQVGFISITNIVIFDLRISYGLGSSSNLFAWGNRLDVGNGDRLELG